MDKIDVFFIGSLTGLMVATLIVAIVKPRPTVEQCATILNQNPEMCLSVYVEEFEKFGC